MSLAPLRRAGRGPEGGDDAVEPVAPRVRPRGRVRSFLYDYRYPLGVFLLSRLLVFGVVWAVGWVHRPKGRWQWGDVFLSPFSAWDSQWYLRIAQHGYDPLIAHGDSPAFFPLYPLLLRGLHVVLPFAGLRLLGVTASTLLFGVALLLLWRLTLERYGEALARRAVTYLAIFPLSFVFSAIYTESLFLTLTLASFLLLERGRIVQASAWGALATLTRPVGVLLAPAIAWRVWSDAGRPWRLWGRGPRVGGALVLRLLPVTLLPAAMVAFQGYLYLVTGQIFATGSAQERGWGRNWDVVLVLKLPVVWIEALWEAAAAGHNMDIVVCMLFAAAWTWLLIEAAWRRRLPGEHLIFAAGSLILAVLAGTYLGVPRYWVGAFPLFWLMAMHGRNEHVDQTLRSAMPALLATLAFVAYGVGTYTP